MRSRLCAFAGASLLLACADPGGSEPPAGVVRSDLLAALDESAEVDVIVTWRAHEPLARTPSTFNVRRQYQRVPALSGRLDRTALEALARDGNVTSIRLDGTGHGALDVAVKAIGGDVAKQTYQVTGKGVRVAVLDTGVNSSHPDLETSVSATQHCFTQGACAGNSAEASSAFDDNGHGSHVSGIITSDGKIAASGFAPDAGIVAVKINDANSSGKVSDWVAGLDWVYDNLDTLGVKIVNLSIATDQLYGSQSECDQGEPALALAVKNLVDAGVTLFASSGNRGSSSQMSAPACLSGVIAVGATYKSSQGRQPMNGSYSDRWGVTFGNCADSSTAFDQVTCFTNSSSRLDLVAPGAVIVSDVLGSATEEYRGTSQASPAAAGVSALMLECQPDLSPSRIEQILVETAVTVTDPKNGLDFPSIRADKAVAEACSSGSGGEGGAPSGGAGGASAGAGAGNGGAAMAGSGGLVTAGASSGGGGNGGNGGASGAGGAMALGGSLAIGGAGGAAGTGASTPTTRATADASCSCRAVEAQPSWSLLASVAPLLLLLRARRRHHRRPRR